MGGDEVLRSLPTLCGKVIDKLWNTYLKATYRLRDVVPQKLGRDFDLILTSRVVEGVFLILDQTFYPFQLDRKAPTALL